MSTQSVAGALAERAVKWVPGGVHSDSRYRPTSPLFAARALGQYLWDVDGTRYLDCTMGNGSVVLGHARPEVDDPVSATIRSGLTTGVETVAAVEAVELMASIIPDFGRVRFANTGTEALMHALVIARHVTGRQGVAKAEGAYHGWADPLWVSTWPSRDEVGPASRPAAPPGSAGLSQSTKNTLVLPFNNIFDTEVLLREKAPSLAAVIIEPVLIDIGYVPATRDYLLRLRELTAELGILLIFDELLTGFRLAPGGAREHYGIKPDLTTYGKALGNGYPIAAVEGTPELLATTDPACGPVGWVGTYNGHPTAVSAAAAVLPLLADGSAQAHLQQLTNRLVSGFGELASKYEVDAVLAGAGGHFQPYFIPARAANYREALASNSARYKVLAEVATREHILLPDRPLHHAALSTAHTTDDVDSILAVVDEAFSLISAEK